MNEQDKELRRQVARYLMDEFLRWQAQHVGRGERVSSQTQFAKEIGLPQTIWSYIVNEARLPTMEQADLIATKLGPRIYEITGYAPRMPKNKYFRKVAAKWYKLTDQQQREYVERIENDTFDGKEEDNRTNSSASPA